MKFVSWNVNGFRAVVKKGFWEKIQVINPDFICLQEIKTDHQAMEDFIKKQNLTAANQLQTNSESSLSTEIRANEALGLKSEHSSNWNIVWHSCLIKKGYSGVAIIYKSRFQNLISKVTFGLEHKEFDDEGRLISIDLNIQNKKLVLMNGYFPQGGRGPHRIDYKIRFYKAVYDAIRKNQQQEKSVILCGDLNTTIKDIDLARPNQNRETTGCLPEERLALSWLITPDLFEKSQILITNPDFRKFQDLEMPSLNLIDAFRHFYPNLKDKYTYWDQITRARERNVGWRIDYFLVDKNILPKVKNCKIEDEVMGSDHAPVVIETDFKY